MCKIENLENIFSGGYIKQMKNLSEKCFIYTIDGNEVSQKEFMKRLLEKGQRKNEKDTKEDNI